MKIFFTMLLSALFITASGGITAEGRLTKAVGQVNKPIKHIPELHGDHVETSSKGFKRQQRLAKFKAALKTQKLQRQLGLSGHHKATAAF